MNTDTTGIQPVKIKLCGLSRESDISAANRLKPEYIGFVFAPGSKRYVSPERARRLREKLLPGIKVVGVFSDEALEAAAELLKNNTIDMAQLHGGEDETYINMLKTMTGKPIIKAFRMETGRDVKAAEGSPADYVLLDSGKGGTGEVFDWRLAAAVRRPYFLAGGLNPDNAASAVRTLRPYAVDVSSGIETGGVKDENKMQDFVYAVRGKEESV